MESLSMCPARRGKISEIWIPATFVEIGLRPLLTLGSQVSIWLAPPSSQRRMQACALVFRFSTPAFARTCWSFRY